VKGLDGRGERVAPAKGLLQRLEKDAEGVKGAVSSTTNEASANNHPAIEKSDYRHFSALLIEKDSRIRKDLFGNRSHLGS
jgi:hypothetical protein